MVGDEIELIQGYSTDGCEGNKLLILRCVQLGDSCPSSQRGEDDI